MDFPAPSSPILTLEPLLDAVREGLESAGWELSGLQKTTSYEFEGRWAGDSSRSAYLFFHREMVPDWASIDVFLDETTRGLKGNLALVVDGRPMGELGDADRVLADLVAVARPSAPGDLKVPLTLRFRLSSLDALPGSADSEARFKVHLPREVIQAGHDAVVALAARVVGAFEVILRAPGLGDFAEGGDPPSDP